MTEILMHLGVFTLAMNIKHVNPGVSMERALVIANTTMHYANVYHLDANLLAAIMAVESRFKEKAKGSAGEIGLMQLHPKFHVATYDVGVNIGAGAEYLATLRSMFSDRLPGLLWIEHYNRGANCKPKKFPYAKRVLHYYAKFGGKSVESKSQARAIRVSKGESREYRRGPASSSRVYAGGNRK